MQWKAIATAVALGLTLAISGLNPAKADILTTPTNLTSTQNSYLFPGRAEDLNPGEYWYRRKKIHGSGQQRLGYDLTAVRFDARRQQWITDKVGTNGTENAHKLIYGEPVYAVADGKVVACWRNAPENPRPGESHPGRTSDPKTIAGGGNYLWVDHGNSEIILYAHFQPGTIPASICPNSRQFMTDAGNASAEGYAAETVLPVSNQPQLKQGQFIGKVGNSGSSSGPHLHIHMQENPPSSAEAVPLSFHKALIKSIENNPDDSPKDWTRLNDSPLPPGPIAILPNFSQGFAEVSRHGVPSSSYQLVFDQITSSGYQLEWIDGYNVAGNIFFNAVFRPANGTPWAAFHNLTGAQYQEKFNQYTGDGFRLKQVESYPSRDGIRYAAIFAKDGGPAFVAYHGLSADKHQERFNQLIQDGWRPKNISVVSVDGKRIYAALYEKVNVGSFVAKSFLTPAQYQQAFDQNLEQGRQIAYLNAYAHDGETRFSAIWNSATKGQFTARHGLSSSDYQAKWEDSLDKGLLTRNVTGYSNGDSHRFAAVWRK